MRSRGRSVERRRVRQLRRTSQTTTKGSPRVPRLVAPGAGASASGPHVRPCGAPGRLARPRCWRSGSKRRSPSPSRDPGLLCSSGQARVPARKPGSFWPSCSSVLFFVSFGTPFGSGAVRTFYPRMFRGHREQHLDVCSADLGTQRPTEGTAAHSLFDALGLGQLGLVPACKARHHVPGLYGRRSAARWPPKLLGPVYRWRCARGTRCTSGPGKTSTPLLPQR